MSLGEDDRNKLGVGVGRLPSKENLEVVERWVNPSVGRFRTGQTWRLSLDKNGPPLGIKTEDIVAKSIAPECSYGVLNFDKVLERSSEESQSSK